MHSRKEKFVMSNNKKFGKLAVLSILGLLALTACNESTSEIVAKPSNYNNPVITFVDGEGKEEGKDVQNNVLKIIEDALHDGSIDTEVFNKIMFKYAESMFGTYNKVTAKEYGEGAISLKDAALDALKLGGDYAIVDEFIKNHQVYWNKDDEGNRVENAEIERANVVAKYRAVEKRIAENMYNRVSSGSYTEKHFFDEVKYLKSLYEAGEKVNYAQAKKDNLAKVIIDYRLEKEEVFSEFEGIVVLHRDYYQDEDKYTFIEDEVIPQIYQDLLVEQYLLEEELATVRDSRARKINVLKIEKYSGFSNNADALVNDLVNQIYNPKASGLDKRTTVENDHEVIEEYYDTLFDEYAIVSKGLYSQINATVNPEDYDTEEEYKEAKAKSDEIKAIVARVQKVASDIYEKDTKAGKDYYKNTTFGDLVEDYAKFKEVNAYGGYEELDKSLYNKFTSNGTVTPEEGFDQEEISIDQSKSITKGWYIQGSAPSLDSNSEIADRLFKLSVGNDKIEVGKVSEGAKEEAVEESIQALNSFDRFQYSGTEWVASKNDEESKYLCSINGAFFLKFEGQYSKDDPLKDIVYDDGSAYYVVQVLEAVKPAKLRYSVDEGSSSYARTRGADFLNAVIDQVTTLIGETGNHSSLSKEYWLKKMNIKYHDQKVYDYFKENYPELF